MALVLGFVVVHTAAAQDSRDRLQHIDSLIAVSSAPSFGHTLQALGAVIVLCQARPPALAAQQALRALCERSFALDSSRAHMRTVFEGRYNPGQFDLLIAGGHTADACDLARRAAGQSKTTGGDVLAGQLTERARAACR